MSRERFGSKTTAFQQRKWEIKQAKNYNMPFHIVPALTPLACLMLILAYNVQGGRQFKESPSEESVVHRNGTSEVENPVCPAPPKITDDGTSTIKVPAEVSVPSGRILKPRLKYYAQFFKSEESKEIPVEIDLNFYLDARPKKDLSQISAKQKRIAQQLQKEIKEILPTLSIHPDVLADIKRTNLKILIVSEDFLEKLYNAKYFYGFHDVATDTIYISIECYGKGKSFITAILSNEIHHAAVTTRNMLHLVKGSKTDLSYPFLNDDGEVDRVRAKNLSNAHKIFRENVNKFIELHHKLKRQENLNSQETLFYREAEQIIIKYYTAPAFESFSMRYADYKIVKELGNSEAYLEYPDGSFRLSKKIFPPGSRYTQDVRVYFPTISSEKEYIEGKFTYAQPDNPQSYIYAFIYDWQSVYEGKLEKSPNNAYSRFSKLEQHKEFSSDIEMYASEIKLFFGQKKWCDYFSKLHDVDEYCVTSAKIGPKKY